LDKIHFGSLYSANNWVGECRFGAAVVDNSKAVNKTVTIGGPASYTWTEVVQAVGKAIGQDLPINYVSFEEPVPLLPEGAPDVLKALETYESFIDMSQTAPMYGIELTPLEAFAKGFFAPVPS
jgi:hypothetical protein